MLKQVNQIVLILLTLIKLKYKNFREILFDLEYKLNNILINALGVIRIYNKYVVLNTSKDLIYSFIS